jgi:cation-transporting ATPase E
MVAAELDAGPGTAGLTEAEAADRHARGLGNEVPAAPTRTVGEILRANVLTPFNFLLGGLLVVILVVGPIQDAVFGLLLIANAATGVIQELRARRSLDRLAVLNAPKARLVRDGVVREAALNEVVRDDVLDLRPGDQVVVDGTVLAGSGLEIDESLLTGESDPVVKEPGAELLSGSFAAAGGGRYRATRVGASAYATTLAEEARRFTLARSELMTGINRVIKLVSWGLVPTAALLLFSQLRANASVPEALRSTVGGVVSMVPEGLVLMTTIAFAVGVVRLARRDTLVQELPAVETLARVDVICLDKTGTITTGDIALDSVEPIGAGDLAEAGFALAAVAAADPNPNATLRAIAAAHPDPGGRLAVRTVPFSSARKWSAADLGPHGVWLLGAPEMLVPGDRAIVAAAEAHAAAGRRVVLLASSPGPLNGLGPPPVEPRALVVLSDQVRIDAPETLRWFAEQGVAVKVISGDHPRTVGAVAARAGVAGADHPVDARTLPAGPDALTAALDGATVFGRVTPRQKHAMVGALQRSGHVVAMTGDGVNDVLALKEADIGVAMGSGSPASRAVARIVLLGGSFAALPAVVGEGRRVLANIERVAKLFLTKTVYSMLLALAVGVAGVPFPFLPRHITLIATFTIGVPAFILALVPNPARARDGFLPRVLHFAVPAGIAAALATFAGYSLAWVARADPEVSVIEAKTTATITLSAMGLVVLARLLWPPTPARVALVGSMAAALAGVLFVPWARAFFDLDPPPLPLVAAALVIVALATALMLLGERLTRHLVATRRRRSP